MIEPISTDRNISKEKFRIINFSVGNGKTIEDLVHNEPPYFHFQVLRPESKDQADKAIEYFKAHNKIYICWASTMDMLLYLGCTETVYLKSKVVTDYQDEDLKNILQQAANWFRSYKDDVSLSNKTETEGMSV